jgi:hypothetical protein
MKKAGNNSFLIAFVNQGARPLCEEVISIFPQLGYPIFIGKPKKGKPIDKKTAFPYKYFYEIFYSLALKLFCQRQKTGKYQKYQTIMK